MTPLGYPETLDEHLEVVVRILKGIAQPQIVDGCVVYSMSDDVPEDISIALSYAEAAKALPTHPASTDSPAEGGPRVCSICDGFVPTWGVKVCSCEYHAPCGTRPAPIEPGVREAVAHEIYDYLNERFPDGPMPGGVQLFADPGDHTDAAMKHEAGCSELADRILALLSSNTGEG